MAVAAAEKVQEVREVLRYVYGVQYNQICFSIQQLLLLTFLDIFVCPLQTPVCLATLKTLDCACLVV